MRLCPICSLRFEKKFEIGECGICSNKMEEAKRIIDDNDFKTEAKNARKFSISSSISRKMMINEERFFDLSKGESIKNQLNRMFYSKIKEKTGMGYDTENPDVVFSINLETLDVSSRPGSLFFFGRYKKLEKEIAQKRWIYEKFPSVEVIIGEKAVPFFGAIDYTMHASGREDIDVTNTAGRPFVMEIREARQRKMDLKKLEQEVNKDTRISVELIGYVPSSFVYLVSDSHFDKAYRAYLECEEGLDDRDFERIMELNGKTIDQQTPIRVMNRRTDKVRQRKVYGIGIGKDENGVYADIDCEAGMYIKELINGDQGRTDPSFSKATNKRITCKSLIVTKINDSFLDGALVNV